MEKELFSDEVTVGELMEAAHNAAPGSVYIDGFKITYIETIEVATMAPAHRWCFTCRTVTEHSVVSAMLVAEPTDTPRGEVRCLACGDKDSDLFPGKEREDDQPE